ncbi:MAG: endonuclease/exonuclease/phosphatase family protein [Verrucomicrobiota bacterium]
MKNKEPKPPKENKPEEAKKPKVTIGGLLDVSATALATATVLGLLGRIHWTLDLLSHFKVQYMQLCLVLIGIELWRHRNKRAIALVLLAAINYAFVLPLYFGKPAPATKKPIRAMLMNLNSGNGNTRSVLNMINEADPDILLLEEVTPKWEKDLKPLKKSYKHRISEPREDSFGIMLLSKHSLKREKVVKIGPAEVPSIIAEVHLPETTFSIIGTHPVPPIGKEYSTMRNKQLMELPAVAGKQKYPVLLLGDLNTTPFSYWFRRLIEESELKNSMKGFGFQPSWQNKTRFLNIPLDHVLHSPEITIHNRMVGGDVGSDHLPVIVDFSVR